MIIKIISIGNKLNKWESETIDFYLKQLPKNIKIDFCRFKKANKTLIIQLRKLLRKNHNL
jgi:hypothetical protein